jgi:DNA-binding CsgD family transcriptional regulator
VRFCEVPGPLAEALDQLAAGVVLADAGGAVVWANRAAVALLGAADGITLGRRDALAAATPSATAALLGLVASAALGTGGALALPRPSGRPTLAASAVPLSGRVAEERLGPLPVVAWPRVLLLLVDPTREPEAGAVERQLRALYGLTGAEAAVAARASRGEGLPAVAEALGVALNTVRAQRLRQGGAGPVGGATGSGRPGERRL